VAPTFFIASFPDVLAVWWGGYAVAGIEHTGQSWD
jgi:hypothetical protein